MPQITKCTDSAKEACESSAKACATYLTLLQSMIADLGAKAPGAGTYGLLLGVERDLTTILQRVAPAHNIMEKNK